MAYFDGDAACYLHPSPSGVVQHILGHVGGALADHPQLSDTLYGLSILGFYLLALAVGVAWEVWQRRG